MDEVLEDIVNNVNQYDPSFDQKGGVDGLKRHPHLIRLLDYINSEDFIVNAEVGKTYWATGTYCRAPSMYYCLGILEGFGVTAKNKPFATFQRNIHLEPDITMSLSPGNEYVRDLFEGWGKSVFNTKESARLYCHEAADRFLRDDLLQDDAIAFHAEVFGSRRTPFRR